MSASVRGAACLCDGGVEGQCEAHALKCGVSVLCGLIGVGLCGAGDAFRHMPGWFEAPPYIASLVRCDEVSLVSLSLLIMNLCVTRSRSSLE